MPKMDTLRSTDVNSSPDRDQSIPGGQKRQKRQFRATIKKKKKYILASKGLPKKSVIFTKNNDTWFYPLEFFEIWEISNIFLKLQIIGFDVCGPELVSIFDSRIPILKSFIFLHILAKINSVAYIWPFCPQNAPRRTDPKRSESKKMGRVGEKRWGRKLQTLYFDV